MAGQWKYRRKRKSRRKLFDFQSNKMHMCIIFFRQGMRYKLNYDGMWHLDIPKTRQYDHGKVEVIARNVCGESRVETTLTVKSRGDDYRGVLKNSPRRKYKISFVLKYNNSEKFLDYCNINIVNSVI